MSKTLKHETKADYLLEKGLHIIWSRGYNGTSVNDIVKAADVPKGSFYFYFDSKEDFAIKALRKYFDMQFGTALGILHDSSVSSPKQRLLNFYEHRIDVVKEELECKMGCMGCNLSNEMSEHNDNIREAILTLHNKVKNEIVAVGLEAQRLGEVEADIDVEAMVSFLEDAGKGAMTTMKEMKSAEPIDNVMKMTKLLFLK